MGTAELSASIVSMRDRGGRVGALVRPWSLSVIGHIVTIAGACALWIAALAQWTPRTINGWGLLAQVGPMYLLALAILSAGFAVAASGNRVHPERLAIYVIALVAMLTATTAILYPEPRYAWVYKHLGVIDYIRRHGSTDRSIDIYNNWPAFFALNAWFSHALGISPERYANWAQCFFELANAAAVMFAVRGVTRSPRRQWIAVWLFEVANWIGQDYLAPQAFALFVSLITVGLLLRCSPPRRPPRTRIARHLDMLGARLALKVGRGRIPLRIHALPPPLSARAGVIVAGLCYLAVVFSHQLSPFFIIAAALFMSAAIRRPPLWMIAAMAAVQVWWTWLAYPFMSRHFKLLDISLGPSARPSLPGAHTAPGVDLSLDLSRLAIAIVALAALLGVVRLLRSRVWEPSSAALMVAPITVISLQSYGGEGSLRAFLFALPWLGVLAAVWVSPRSSASLLRRSWRLLAVTLAVGACALPGLFSQEPLNYYTADDVAAGKWYLDHAPAHASLTELADNAPLQFDANYARHLSPPAAMASRAGYPVTLAQVKRFLACDHSPQRYVLFTPSQERFVLYYGLLPAGTYGRLVAAMKRSPDFRLVYRRGAAYVFRYAPNRSGSCQRGGGLE
jgi:hypothetical protein